MTLNLRLRTPQSAIHFSDGRLTERGTREILSDHTKKILFSDRYLISMAGTLDRIDKRFDLIERLRTDLKYVENLDGFRQLLFELVLDEYSKDNLNGVKSCDVLLGYRSADGSIFHETLTISSNGVLENQHILNGALSNARMVEIFEQFNIDHLVTKDFYSSLIRDSNHLEPKYLMDHNHLYGSPMPEHAMSVIPVLFAASYYKIKGQLPSVESIENLNDDEIRQIGILFYQKFYLYKGGEDDTIGLFEDGFKLM